MKQWFAIRVTYNREMKVKRELDRLHIENFLPMKHRVVVCINGIAAVATAFVHPSLVEIIND